MYKLKQILHTFPFTVPGNLQVRLEVNTIPEDVTAYSCYLLRIPAWGLPTSSPSGLKAGILTSTAPAEGIDPIRACLEAK